jgi:hypothetical protein
MLVSGRQIIEKIARSTRSLELVSPYLHGSGVEDALTRSPARRKRLITRYRPFDILAGATDLALLDRLRRKVEIRFLEDVHARFFVVDASWAYVGSSLLTKAGLDDSGADLGVAVTDEGELNRVYARFATLWSQAGELSPAQWTLALHAADEAMELVEKARSGFLDAERALGRFVDIPRLRKRSRPLILPNAARQTPAVVRSRVNAWSGKPEAAYEVAAFLGWAIEAIPNAAQSEAWTVLLGDHHLRLKLGLPEVVTIEEGDEGATLSVMGLASMLHGSERELLHRAGATIIPSPWASATGLSRDAVRIGNVALDRVALISAAIKPGLAEYMRLHWSQAPTMAKRAFASSVLEYLEDELDRPLPWPKDRIREAVASG